MEFETWQIEDLGNSVMIELQLGFVKEKMNFD